MDHAGLYVIIAHICNNNPLSLSDGYKSRYRFDAQLHKPAVNRAYFPNGGYANFVAMCEALLWLPRGVGQNHRRGGGVVSGPGQAHGQVQL